MFKGKWEGVWWNFELKNGVNSNLTNREQYPLNYTGINISELQGKIDKIDLVYNKIVLDEIIFYKNNQTIANIGNSRRKARNVVSFDLTPLDRIVGIKGKTWKEENDAMILLQF